MDKVINFAKGGAFALVLMLAGFGLTIVLENFFTYEEIRSVAYAVYFAMVGFFIGAFFARK